MEYKRCNRCVMDNISDRTITFNSLGQCNYCTDVINRINDEYFPNEKGTEELEKIIKIIKKENINSKYDCLVGVSGGVDSSYILYLGYKYGLRMLAVHFDDGLDTLVAKQNINDLCKAANVDLINVFPDKKQYADLILSFFKASLPNIAMPQDNILFKELYNTIKKYNIKYTLNGANMAHESILERFDKVNSGDKFHIKTIHKLFGTISINKLNMESITESYITRKYFANIKTVYPLNYINYNLKSALEELNLFSNFQYYGGKHYENILTRFLQCYYLPTKYNFDKRKSHFSSLIISGQMDRDEALEVLKSNPYIENRMMDEDMKILSDFMSITVSEFKYILNLPPKLHSDYPNSHLNKLAPLARKFRKFLG